MGLLGLYRQRDQRNQTLENVQRIRAVHDLAAVNIGIALGRLLKLHHAKQVLVQGNDVKQLDLAVAVHIAVGDVLAAGRILGLSAGRYRRFNIRAAFGGAGRFRGLRLRCIGRQLKVRSVRIAVGFGAVRLDAVR